MENKNILNLIINLLTDKSDHTMPRFIFICNSIFSLLLATNTVFPVQEKISYILSNFDMRIPENITLLVWYCCTFLFLVTASFSTLSLIIYQIIINTLRIADKEYYQYNSNSSAEQFHILFCATKSAYINIFDYLVFSCFALFVVTPTELETILKNFTNDWSSIKFLLAILTFLPILECASSLTIYIIKNWICPDISKFQKL